MKKVWKNYGTFRGLEPRSSEFLEDQERVLGSDREWPKVRPEPPIGGEVAWPLIGEENDQADS